MPPKYRGQTRLPDCVWKRACPVCGARAGAVCFDPKTGKPKVTEVHSRRRDRYNRSAP